MEECTAQLQDLCNTQEQIQRILTRMYLILATYTPSPLQRHETPVPDHVWTLVDMLLDLILTPNPTVRIRELSLSVLQALCPLFQDVCDKICLQAKLDALVELVHNDTSYSIRAPFWSLMGHIAAQSDACHPRLLSLVDMCVQTIPPIPHQDDSPATVITTFHCIRFIGNLSVHPANCPFLINHHSVLPVLTKYLSDPVVDLCHMAAIIACANLGVDVSLQQCVLLIGSLQSRVMSTDQAMDLTYLTHFTDVRKLLYTFSCLLKDPSKRLFFREVGLCKVIEQILLHNSTYHESILPALQCLWLLQHE